MIKKYSCVWKLPNHLVIMLLVMLSGWLVVFCFVLWWSNQSMKAPEGKKPQIVHLWHLHLRPSQPVKWILELTDKRIKPEKNGVLERVGIQLVLHCSRTINVYVYGVRGADLRPVIILVWDSFLLPNLLKLWMFWCLFSQGCWNSHPTFSPVFQGDPAWWLCPSTSLNIYFLR